MAYTQTEKLIHEWIHLNKPSILKLVSDLIGFNTVNEVMTGREKPCQLFVADVMGSMGLDVDVFTPEDVPGLKEHPAYFPGKDYSQRPNVVGVWKGTGNGRSLIFSSHCDTTVAAQGWLKDPWTPRLENGKLYGLGSFDMKGGLAASIMAVHCLREIGVRLEGDVLVESVVDEEFGGANGTLASRLRGYNGDAAIIPEPTNLAVCPATRGGALWRVTFSGNAGMSFSGETIVNPANLAAKFMVFLEEFGVIQGKRPGPAPWYEQDVLPPAMVTRVEAGDMNALLCDTGPSECHVDMWVECHPGVSEEQLKQELVDGFYQKYGSGIGEPVFKKMIRFLPGTQLQADFPLIHGLARQVEAVTGRKASVHGAPFACDAFMFNLYSTTPAIVMGPVGANAHAPDEYIEIEAFWDLIEIYARTIMQWCVRQDTSNGVNSNIHQRR